MAQNEKGMLGEFLSTIIRFIGKMLGWAFWAIFRITELISGGMATWIKNALMQ
jgi:hypothetical protein